MRKNRLRFSTYNDGAVFIYRAKKRQTDFNAPRNVNVMDDMEFIVRLDYEECSKRLQDLEFAEQRGFSLSLKIKTRFVEGVDNKCKAVIDGYLYDIANTDKSKTELYLFLEGVKAIDS